MPKEYNLYKWNFSGWSWICGKRNWFEIELLLNERERCDITSRYCVIGPNKYRRTYYRDSDNLLYIEQ